MARKGYPIVALTMHIDIGEPAGQGTSPRAVRPCAASRRCQNLMASSN